MSGTLARRSASNRARVRRILERTGLAGRATDRRGRPAMNLGDILLNAAGVILILGATVLGTLAAFAWVFANLGFDPATVGPMASLAVVCGLGGIALLVWVQHVPVLRFLGLLLVFGGLALGLLGVALWQLAGEGWEAPAIGALISAGVGAGLLLRVAQR